ncbi:hypothetical protein [Paraburkholderia fungorum]|uniref:hypothetical protein n=1 Tax=Paraburkholderia fungorum TaxID=134537 RepID=UPI003D6B66CC
MNLTSPDKADAVCMWSPWRGSSRDAWREHFERSGRPVIVAENGFLSPIHDEPYYQVALSGWNGTGSFPAGDGSRWASWGIDLAPWVERPVRRALVIGQRGHPSDDRTCLPGWHKTVDVDCPLAMRRDPGAPWPLGDDFRAASHVHVWTSNAASHAVIAGLPVVQHGPNLMVGALASRPSEDIVRPERLPVLEVLAWTQWSASEIASGLPFQRLLA